MLLAWGRGDQAAFDELVPLVHDELRRIARHHMRGERGEHTLQPSALVNEAYLRLLDIKRVQWQNRAHCFAMAARVMRRVLVESARARKFQKRGGGARRVSLEEALVVSTEPGQDLVALDDAGVVARAGEVRSPPHFVKGMSTGRLSWSWDRFSWS